MERHSTRRRAGRPIVGRPLDSEALDATCGGFDAHGYGSGPVTPLRPLPGLSPGMTPYLQFTFQHPGTGTGVQWNNGEVKGVQSFEAGRASVDLTRDAATFNYDMPTVVPGLTYGPRLEVNKDGHLDLQAGAKFGAPTANVEVGVQHIQDVISRADADAKVDALRAAWDAAHQNPNTETFTRLAAAEKAIGNQDTVRALEERHAPPGPTVWENTPGSPGAAAAAAMNDPSVAMHQQAFQYMQDQHITIQDAQAAAARGAPITVPGGSNATSDWGPQQIIPAGPLAGPLAAPYELRAAPLPATTGDLMRSLGYSQSEIDGINARNAGAGAPPAPGDAHQYDQYSELGPNNELDAAYRDAHQYDQYSELGPNNELDAAYRDAHQYDQYSEYGPNNELLSSSGNESSAAGGDSSAYSGGASGGGAGDAGSDTSSSESYADSGGSAYEETGSGSSDSETA